MKNLFVVAGLSALLLGISEMPRAFSADEISTAEQLYAAHNYTQAEQILEHAIKINENNAAAHYLLGNVLMATNRPTEAGSHYYQAFIIDPNSKLGEYCKMALERIQKLPAAQAAAATSAPPGPSSLTAEQRSAGAVSQETNEEETRLNAERDAQLKAIIDEGDRRTRELQADMNSQISANGSRRYRMGMLYYDPTSMNEAIKSEIQPKIDQIKSDTRRRIDDLNALYKQKIEAVENNALHVDRSYIGKGGRVGTAPLGTNMYTHNYETMSDPSGNPVPVQAAPGKLLTK